MGSTSNNVCAGCNNLIPNSLFLNCGTCKLKYDIGCVNMSKEQFQLLELGRKETWTCPICRSRIPKTDNQNSPVRPTSALSTALNIAIEAKKHSENVTTRKGRRGADDVADNGKSENTRMEKSRIQSNQNILPSSSPSLTSEAASDVSVEVRLLRDEIKASIQEFRSTVAGELYEFRSVVSRLADAMEMCEKRVDDLSSRVEALERERDQRDKISNNLELEKTIVSLQMDLNDRDQEILHNDIEIAGIPEENNELALHLALTVSNKLGVTLEERDIVYAERVGATRRGDTQDSGFPRIRPLVVRLARRSQRDQLLAAARVRRGITTADMGLTTTVRNFYVNERLTKRNRHLFFKARAEAMLKQWKYVWTRDGCIYARKEQGAPRHRLRTVDDIVKVFG